MIKYLSKSEFIQRLQQTFESGSHFIFTPSGNSMKPMLDGKKDKVLLVAKREVLHKYDVVLFRRKRDNALILHRVVKVNRDNTYKLSGDSQYYFDDNVSYDDVYAVVNAFTHKGKLIYVTNFLYCIYSRIILVKKYIRVFLSKIYHSIFK